MSPAVRNILIASIIAIALIGLAFFVVIKYQKSEKEKLRHTAEYNSALKVIGKGGDQNQVEGLRKLLASTKDAEEKASVRLALAHSIFSRGDEEGAVEAIPLYKSIAADEGVTPKTRSFALSSLAFVSKVRNFDDNFLRERVFNDEPLKSLLGDATPRAGIAKLYRRADELYPRPFTKLELAVMEYRSIRNLSSLTAQERGEIAGRIEDLVKKATINMEAPDAHLMDPHILIWIYFDRALAWGAVNRLRGDQRPNTDLIAQDFSRALEIAERTQGTIPWPETVRIYYAAWLWERYGRGKMGEIQKTLTPVISQPLGQPLGFGPRILDVIRALKKPPYDALLGLAGDYPEMKNYLNLYGWGLK